MSGAGLSVSQTTGTKVRVFDIKTGGTRLLPAGQTWTVTVTAVRVTR